MSQKALLFFASLLLSTTAVGTASTAQAGPINWAQVIKLVNKVQFKPTNAGWRAAQGSDRLQQSGEALFTSRGSRADLRLSEGSLLRMSSNTHLWIQPNSRNLLQRSGTALYVIKPGGGSTLISTPYGRAGVRGSALFVRVNEQTGTMIVGALTNNPAGDMEITTENGPKQLLKAGQMAVVRGGTITTFEFDLNTFYQTSSLVQGFGLDGKPIVDADGSLADPEVQQTLAAVQAETLPALTAQAPVAGSNVAVNPEFLNSSPRDLKPVDLVMQATNGNFDRNSTQTAAGLAAVRPSINPPEETQAATIATPPPIPPVAVQPATVQPAAVAPPTGNGTIVPLPNTPPLPTAAVTPPTAAVTPPTAVVTPPTAVVTPTPPTVATPPTAVDPGRTTPNNTPAIQPIQPIAQPNNPQLPIVQPPQAGNVNPTPISQPNQAGQVAQPPPIRVEIRVEVEKWSYPSKVETPRSNPTLTPPSQPPIAAPVAPTPPSVTAPIAPPTTPPASTTSIQEKTIIAPPTTVVAPPTTLVAPPTTVVAPPTTVVAPPTTVVAPIAPKIETPPVIQPIVPATPIAPVAPTVAPSIPVAAPTPVVIPDRALPTIVPATTPDPTLTAPQ